MPERPLLTLIHGYGFDDKGRDKPDIRGRLTILAAQELMRRGATCQAAIVAGSQQHNEPELAGPMFRQFHRNNPRLLEGPDIIVSPVAGGTIGELEEFRRITQGVGVDNLAVLATKTHLGRIKRRLEKLYGKEAMRVRIFEVEDVLTNATQSKRYQNLVETLTNSADEQDFIRREATTKKIERMPFGVQAID